MRTWTEKKREKMAFFLEEERRSSQVESPRSPSIVARLMGLELVPENNPHDHSQKKKNKNNEQHHLRKPLQVKNSNTINHSSPPSPLPPKLKSRLKASSRHGYNNENENENVVKEVKKHCKKNKEAKKNILVLLVLLYIYIYIYAKISILCVSFEMNTVFKNRGTRG